MRKQFTNYELSKLVSDIFTSNDISFTITDSQSEQTSVDSIVDYLNIDFYSFRKELKDTDLSSDMVSQLEQWYLSSANGLNHAYGLVEIEENSVMTSYDFDGGSIRATITIMIQSDKVSNLDYFITYIRNKYVGVIEDLVDETTNTTYSTHLVFSNVESSEPTESAFGTASRVTIGLDLSYMEKSMTYQDERFGIALDFDTNGDLTQFDGFPISRCSENIIFTGKAQIRQNTPNLSGQVNANATLSFTFTYWLLNSYETLQELDDTMKGLCYSYRYFRGTQATFIENTAQDINVPVYILRNNLVYKMVVSSYTRDITNNDMTVITMKLSTYAK